MKTISSLGCLLVLVLALAGCRDRPAPPAAGEANPKDDFGIAFTPKAGLSVPEDVARHIGLELAGVTERKVRGQVVFTAQVYAEAGPQARRVALASAWVEPALAHSLATGTDLVATTVGTNSRPGVVTRVVPAASTSSPAEILLELRAGPGELKVGDFARVTVTTGGRDAVTVVPRAAVQVGGEQDGFMEIKRGLLAGDKIAVAGVAMLRLAELHHVNGGDACCVPH